MLALGLVAGVELGACVNALEGDQADAADQAERAGQALLGQRPAAQRFDPAALRTAKRRTLVDGIAAAENQWFTSTGRLFISGDDGIYEILADASGNHSARAIHTGETCQFGGLTELRATLYANCYDSTDSTIFAAALSDAPEFRAIYQLPGTGLANGLTSDGTAHLFVASTFEGIVIRLTTSPADPLAIQARDTFLPDSGFATNGIKYFGDKLFWSALLSVNSAEISSNGSAGKRQTLLSALTLFDDLYVDETGVLVADYLNGTVIALPADAGLRRSSPNGMLDGPSSVQPTGGRLGLPPEALIITERDGNRVSLLEP